MAYETEKQNAAAAAMEFVEDGMTIGLGTGSTAKYFVELLADEIADGLLVRCIETSNQTRDLARSLGVPLIPFEQVDRIHLTVDGADEAGPGGVLIKGGGAALLREKIIANASDHMVVIADPTKDVQAIGAFPLPVEVTPFGYTITAKKVHDALVAAGVERPRVELRKAPRSDSRNVSSSSRSAAGKSAMLRRSSAATRPGSASASAKSPGAVMTGSPSTLPCRSSATEASTTPLNIMRRRAAMTSPSSGSRRSPSTARRPVGTASITSARVPERRSTSPSFSKTGLAPAARARSACSCICRHSPCTGTAMRGFTSA
jgi:ribose 5-phosphate isomerase A